MTNTKIIKGNEYSLTEMNPIQLRMCPLTLLLYNFALMGIIYGGVYIGPVLRTTWIIRVLHGQLVYLSYLW